MAEPATDELIAQIEEAQIKCGGPQWVYANERALIARIREQEKAMHLMAKTHLLQVKMECAKRDATIKRMDEALERAETFIVNGTEYGFITMPDDPLDTAKDTLPAIRAARKEPT